MDGFSTFGELPWRVFAGLYIPTPMFGYDHCLQYQMCQSLNDYSVSLMRNSHQISNPNYCTRWGMLFGSMQIRYHENTWWRHQMEHFPRHWPVVRRIHRSPMDSPHKGQWRRTLIFSLICTWTNGQANNGDVVDLRRYRIMTSLWWNMRSSPSVVPL